MRNFALLAASSAGALLMIVVQADAMTFSNTASARDASADAVKPEQVRWCRMRNCPPRYYEPPPYYWGWSLYQPWPYYPYNNFGTGQSRFGFAH